MLAREVAGGHVRLIDPRRSGLSHLSPATCLAGNCFSFFSIQLVCSDSK